MAKCTMTKREWLDLILDELESGYVEENIYTQPEIDLSLYQGSLRLLFVDYYEALIRWLDGISKELNDADFRTYHARLINIIISKIRLIGSFGFSGLCEKIIRVHGLGFNYPEDRPLIEGVTELAERRTEIGGEKVSDLFKENSWLWHGDNSEKRQNELEEVSLNIVRLLAESNITFSEMETVINMCKNIMCTRLWERPDYLVIPDYAKKR